MEFTLSETDSLVQQTARDYATRIIAPQAARIDATEKFPHEIIRGLAELGLTAITLSPHLGGAGAGVVAYALAMQEIARACASTAVMASVTNMVAETIARFGTDAQKSRHCPRLGSGELGSFALSEADAGSDPGAMRTTARRDANGWVIDGTKQWITGATYAGVLLVWARTTPTASAQTGTKGISCFLVENGAQGLKVGRPEDKMGIRGSNTVPIQLEACRVPFDSLLGDEGDGFKIAMSALDGGRIGISAQAVGIARAALAESIAYAKERHTFGAPIGAHQAIQWKLADMQVLVDAANLLSLRAAWLKEKGRRFRREASMAKLFASEAAVRICNDAVQIHGGYGYVRELPVERHLRDARVTTIYEGTSEIQRIVIARESNRAFSAASSP